MEKGWEVDKEKQMAVLNYESFQLILSEHKEEGYKINSRGLFTLCFPSLSPSL